MYIYYWLSMGLEPRPAPKQMAKTPSLAFRFYGLRIIWLKEAKRLPRNPFGGMSSTTIWEYNNLEEKAVWHGNRSMKCLNKING